MLNRKLLIGFTTVWLSSIALANGGVPTETTEVMPAPTPVITPYHGGLFVGAELLYWQPNNDKLDYAIVDAHDNGRPIGYIAQVKPSHEFGFSVFGGYRCPIARSDISVGYTRFHTTDHASATAPEDGQLWARLIHPGAPGEAEFDDAVAHVEFDYDAFDLMFGQKMDVNRLNMHFAAGMRYIKLDSQLNVDYTKEDKRKDDCLSLIQRVVDLGSEYYGIGPRVNAAGIYHIGAGLGIEASAGASLLVGRGKLTEYQVHDFDTSDPHPMVGVDIDSGKTNRIVPELDAKFGLNYTVRTPNLYNFSIGAGWQVVNYFNVRDSIKFTSEEEHGAYVHIVSDVSFNGPYAGIVILAS
jgi:hypothetical protein